MTYFLLTVVVVILYGTVTTYEYRQSRQAGEWGRGLFGLLAWLAILGHAYVLHRAIDMPQGQNLSVPHLCSLIAWLAGLILLIGQLSLPITALGLLVYPIAALALALAAIWPGDFIVSTGHHPWALFHILWSTLVVGLFVIGGCQATLLALQERLLRRKKLTGLLARLPPLQVMETVLFKLVKLGVLALSILLLSSVFLFQEGALPGLWSKTLLALCIWLVFSGLLAGRHFLGWRGNTAVVWTVTGVALSLGVYLGSHFLLFL